MIESGPKVFLFIDAQRANLAQSNPGGRPGTFMNFMVLLRLCGAGSKS